MAKGQATATYDDVNLVLRLYEMRREEKLRAARAWFSASFKPSNFEDLMKICPPGTPENANFRMVVSYWEMTCGFVTAGVLNQDLFFESGKEFLMVWGRIQPAVEGLRGMFQDPTLYRNLESASKACAEWMDARAPGSYAAFESIVIKR
jgi:hypothetical protein